MCRKTWLESIHNRTRRIYSSALMNGLSIYLVDLYVQYMAWSIVMNLSWVGRQDASFERPSTLNTHTHTQIQRLSCLTQTFYRILETFPWHSRIVGNVVCFWNQGWRQSTPKASCRSNTETKSVLVLRCLLQPLPGALQSSEGRKVEDLCQSTDHSFNAVGCNANCL